MSKAIVEVPRSGDYFDRAMAIARCVEAGAEVPEADYHLGFASTEDLFAALTPARLGLLDALKALGPVTVAALAAHMGRAVHADTVALLDLGLAEQDAAGLVWVPWDEVQIRVAVAQAA